MASDRKTRYTTADVLRFFQDSESSFSESSDGEEDFQRYVGTIASSSDENSEFCDASFGEDRSVEDRVVLADRFTLETASGQRTTDLPSLPVHGTEFGSVNASSSEPHAHTEMEAAVQENSANELQQDSDDSDKDKLEHLEVSSVVSDSEGSSESIHHDSSDDSDDEPPTHSIRGRGRGACGGRRGRGRGARGGKQEQGQGAGQGQGIGQGRAKRSKPALPELARSIEETDDEFEEFKDDDNFCAIREAGPQLPDDGSMLSELDLFGLYIGDEVIERLVEATKQYAEKQKDSKASMYRKFKQSSLTAEEMRRYIGVLLLLSICSIRSYRQAWNPRSSQVRHTYTLLIL